MGGAPAGCDTKQALLGLYPIGVLADLEAEERLGLQRCAAVHAALLGGLQRECEALVPSMTGGG
jgi:hypothetical protein